MRRRIHISVTLAVALAGSPAAAAPGADSGQCWAKVDAYRDQATARWTADDPAGALSARLDLLAQAVECGDVTAERLASIQVGFENVFVQVVDGAELDAARGADVHRWYDDFTARHPAAAAELADAYRRFSDKVPAPAPERADEPQPPPATVPQEDPDPVPARPPEPERRGKALTIGGAGILAIGLGAVAAGFVSVGRTAATQRELNEHCAVTCGDADTSAELLARGQLHETLAPALLASGAVVAVTGAVLLGLGVRKQRTPVVAPVLHPRFAGASWVLRF